MAEAPAVAVVGQLEDSLEKAVVMVRWWYGEHSAHYYGYIRMVSCGRLKLVNYFFSLIINGYIRMDHGSIH